MVPTHGACLSNDVRWDLVQNSNLSFHQYQAFSMNTNSSYVLPKACSGPEAGGPLKDFFLLHVTVVGTSATDKS